MACKRYQESLIDLALGALGSAQARELRAHLEQCAACREQFEKQERLSAAIDRGIAASVEAQPSGELVARIRQRIAAEPAPVVFWWQGLRPAWLPVVAGALAVLALTVWFTRRAPHVPPTISSHEVASKQSPSVDSAPLKIPGGAPLVAAARSELHSRIAQRRGVNPAAGEAQSARSEEPEVLIPRGEREAMMQFYAVLRSGQADTASLTKASTSLDIPELTIPVLEVKPLPENATDVRTIGPSR